MTTKKDVIRYIIRQRKNGYDDEAIRRMMYVNGYQPDDMNKYFSYIDRQRSFAKNTLIIVVFFLIIAGSIFVVGKTIDLTGADLTGAGLWSWPYPWSTTYNCGDDYPAEERYVMDLSECVNDTEATKQIVFCYLNYTINTSRLLPEYNTEAYFRRNGVNISAIDEVDSVSLFGAGTVFPYNATDEDIDCYEWMHGTTRTEDWHQCNASQENLVFYFAGYDNFIDEGLFSTELHYNSSYYLCYDELNCTTQTTACDESNNYYCVGRLDDTTSSSWHPCDTTDAPYYRCCKGGCDNAVEMMCGEFIEDTEGNYMEFNECSSDETSGCCDSSTDCVYDNECYNEDETIRYHYLQLGLVTSGETIIEPIDEYYTFTCTDAHWCPWGFEYVERSGIGVCAPLQAACYDATDPDYCNYIWGPTNRNLWEADTGGGYPCTRPDPEGVFSKEACVYTGTYGGVDYFFYQDILVDV